MLSFLARTFLILAAAFGLGAIGGRATRRRGAPKAASPGFPKAVSAETIEPRPSTGETSAVPDALLAGAIAGETGSDVGGSNMLAESEAPVSPPTARKTALGADAPAPSGATDRQVAAQTDGLDPSHVAAPSRTDDPGIESEPQAAFASYGGSGVSAGVERMSETELATAPNPTAPNPAAPEPAKPDVQRARSRWSELPAADGVAASPEPAAADSAAEPATHDQSPEEGHVPPSAGDGMPEDPLAAKHRSESFDSDFRTLDYSSLGDEPAPRPASGVGAMDDGWTVPEDGGLAGQPVFEESPAAFRSVGGSAPLRGAPEGDETSNEGAEAGETAEGPDGSTAAPSGPDISADEPVAPPMSAPRPDEPPVEGRAARLEAARGGVPDDLTRISGIGPSIERLLFENGVFHFDQIAAWTEADARWADSLSGFRGRVAREKWIEQARDFAGRG